jgi:DNA-binding XRE family transcriptional regulator
MRVSRLRRRAQGAADTYVTVHPDDAAKAAEVGAALLYLVPLEELGPLLMAVGRTAAGLTQEQLADAGGLSRPQVARMENGEARITQLHAEAVAEHVQVPARLLVHHAFVETRL